MDQQIFSGSPSVSDYSSPQDAAFFAGDTDMIDFTTFLTNGDGELYTYLSKDITRDQPEAFPRPSLVTGVPRMGAFIGENSSPFESNPFQQSPTPPSSPFYLQKESVVPAIKTEQMDDEDDKYDYTQNMGAGKSKSERRALQNRMASKSYRQRKKEHFQELEGQVNLLLEENKRLRSSKIDEGSLALRLQQLEIENNQLRAALRNQSAGAQASPMETVAAVLSKNDDALCAGSVEVAEAREQQARNKARMDELVEMEQRHIEGLARALREDADDDTLRRQLDEVHQVQKQLRALIAAQRDTVLREVRNEDHVEDQAPADDDVSRQFMTLDIREVKELGLSPTQYAQVSTLRQSHVSRVKGLVLARKSIAGELRELIKAALPKFKEMKNRAQEVNANPSSTNETCLTKLERMPEFQGLSQRLQAIKANAQEEAYVMDATISTFQSILTPRQEAMWQLRVRGFKGCRNKVLNLIWDVVAQRSSNSMENAIMIEAM